MKVLESNPGYPNTVYDVCGCRISINKGEGETALLEDDTYYIVNSIDMDLLADFKTKDQVYQYFLAREPGFWSQGDWAVLKSKLSTNKGELLC